MYRSKSIPISTKQTKENTTDTLKKESRTNILAIYLSWLNRYTDNTTYVRHALEDAVCDCQIRLYYIYIHTKIITLYSQPPSGQTLHHNMGMACQLPWVWVICWSDTTWIATSVMSDYCYLLYSSQIATHKRLATIAQSKREGFSMVNTCCLGWDDMVNVHNFQNVCTIAKPYRTCVDVDTGSM